MNNNTNNSMNMEAQIFASEIITKYGNIQWVQINAKAIKLQELNLRIGFNPGERPTLEKYATVQADCAHLIIVVARKQAEIATQVARWYTDGEVDDIARVGHLAALHAQWNDNEARRAQLAERSLLVDEAIDLTVELTCNRMVKGYITD